MQSEQVAIEQIALEKKYQMRVTGVSDDTVEQYAQAMEEGAEFPPVVVYRVDDGKLLLCDGWHRVAAAKMLGQTEIAAEVLEGSREDALAHARFKANRTNGQRLNRSDLQALVEAVVTEPEYQNRTDSELGRLLGVAGTTVAATRKRLGVCPTVRVSSDGRVWVRKEETGDEETEVNYGTPPAGPECPENYGRETLASKVLQRLGEHLEDLGASTQKLKEVLPYASDGEIQQAREVACQMVEVARVLCCPDATTEATQ